MIIYRVTNKVNGKVYIGLTKFALMKRVYRHFWYGTFYFGAALRKYGYEAFLYEIIDRAQTRKELGEKEKYWIKVYDCMAPRGYNLTSGGECGYERSAETKKKMGEARKRFFATPAGMEAREELRLRRRGATVSEETRAKLSAASKGKINWWKGKHRPRWSEERKEKELPRFKAINVGRVRTAEARKACSDGQKRHAAESDYVNPMQGKERPDLAERNKSEAARAQSRKNGLANKGKRKGVAFTPEHRAAIQATFDRKRAERLAAKAEASVPKASAPGGITYITHSFVEWQSVELFGIPEWMREPPEQMSLF